MPLITLAALPFALLMVWVLARRRLVESTSALAWRRSLVEVGIVYGTVPWVWLTLLPASLVSAHTGDRVSLVPLRDLFAMGTFQIVGNLLVFAALGFLAPLRFGVLASVPRVLAVAASASVMIETAQFVLPLDRVSSVDDVLLNAMGAALAALASRPWWGCAGAVPLLAEVPGAPSDHAGGRTSARRSGRSGVA